MRRKGESLRTAVKGGATISVADELFVSLDGQIVETTEGAWEVRVMGIHQERSRFWTQVTLEGGRSYAATFCVTDATPGPLLASMKQWLTAREAAAACSL
jgi:hypothetical protein